MAIAAPQSPIVTATPTSTSKGAMAMATTLFFMWGFLTALNDILVPHLKNIFDLTYAEVMLVQFSFFSAYFFFSVPSGKLIEWIGYKRSMVAGLFTMGLGALLFIPAASVPSFPLFLGALIVLAAGITVLQVSANPYVSVLGPPETASSRLNLAQAFNSLGTTIAPYLGGLFILTATARSVDQLRQMPADALQAYRLQEASSVKLPYLGLGLALIVLGIIIARFRFPVIASADPHEAAQAAHQSVWKYRHLALGAIGIFVYVGAEVSIGSFLVNYFSQPNIGNVSEKVAAGFVSFYWGCAMLGRFIGSAVLQRLKAGAVLGGAAILAFILVMTSLLSTGHFAMWSIILVGLFNSVMFPNIFTLGIAGLGPLTGKASGVLVMSIVGGAILPLLMGALADRVGVHHALLLPALCYLYIVFYGFRGSTPRTLPA